MPNKKCFVTYLPHPGRKHLYYARRFVRRKYGHLISEFKYDKKSGNVKLKFKKNVPYPEKLVECIVEAIDNQILFADTRPVIQSPHREKVFDELVELEQLECIILQIPGPRRMSVLLYQLDSKDMFSLNNLRYNLYLRFKEIRRIELHGNKLAIWVTTDVRKNHITRFVEKALPQTTIVKPRYPFRGTKRDFIEGKELLPQLHRNSLKRTFREVKGMEVEGDKLVIWVTTTARKRQIISWLKKRNVKVTWSRAWGGKHKRIYVLDIIVKENFKGGVQTSSSTPATFFGPSEGMKFLYRLTLGNDIYLYRFLVLCRSDERKFIIKEINYKKMIFNILKVNFKKPFRFKNRVLFFETNENIDINKIKGMKKYSKFYLVDNIELKPRDIFKILNINIKNYRYEKFIPREYQISFLELDSYKNRKIPEHRQKWYQYSSLACKLGFLEFLARAGITMEEYNKIIENRESGSEEILANYPYKISRSFIDFKSLLSVKKYYFYESASHSYFYKKNLYFSINSFSYKNKYKDFLANSKGAQDTTKGDRGDPMEAKCNPPPDNKENNEKEEVKMDKSTAALEKALREMYGITPSSGKPVITDLCDFDLEIDKKEDWELVKVNDVFCEGNGFVFIVVDREIDYETVNCRIYDIRRRPGYYFEDVVKKKDLFSLTRKFVGKFDRPGLPGFELDQLQQWLAQSEA